MLLLLAVAGATADRIPCPAASRDDLLTCFDQLLDTNHDGNITVGEIDTFLAAQLAAFTADPENGSCLTRSARFFQTTNGTAIMTACDLNHDGVLTASADWALSNNNATSGVTVCATNNMIQDYVCRLCHMCGATAGRRK